MFKYMLQAFVENDIAKYVLYDNDIFRYFLPVHVSSTLTFLANNSVFSAVEHIY